MSLVANERIKYLATFINNLATACIVAGVVTPAVALSFGNLNSFNIVQWLVSSAFWVIAGAILHFAVRFVLGRLQ